MLKKAVQLGRRRVETRGGTNRTPWGHSPVQWILANGKTPPALPTSENLSRYVEDFDEPRMTLADFFSILVRRLSHCPRLHAPSSPTQVEKMASAGTRSGGSRCLGQIPDGPDIPTYRAL